MLWLLFIHPGAQLISFKCYSSTHAAPLIFSTGFGGLAPTKWCGDIYDTVGGTALNQRSFRAGSRRNPPHTTRVCARPPFLKLANRPDIGAKFLEILFSMETVFKFL